MKRFIEKELLQWKNSSHRSPLIVRGSRNVGKSYTIEKFGKDNFKNHVVVNFELQPEFSCCFDTVDPEIIISKIELLTNQSIEDGVSLLFFDEIQYCPKALLALRYFKERKPSLHVIAAGSLLEFVLNEEHFSFSLDLVQFLYMRPISFHEFLYNLGHHNLLDLLENISLQNPPNEILHDHLLKIVRQYMLLGGMPSVVSKYIETNSYLESIRLQKALLEMYRSDFGKYTSKTQLKHLQRVYDKASFLVAQHFKFVDIDPEVRSRVLKIALQQLSWMGLINQVFSTNANSSLPAEMKQNKFKLLFLDIGLLQNANRVDPNRILHQDIWQINEGVLTKQFVGQELLAYGNCYENTTLFFWEREQPSSTSKVDYVTQIDSKILPLEVKGTNRRLKSMKRFMEEKKTNLGIKISDAPLELKDQILNLPFYLIGQMSRLIQYHCT